MPSAKLPPHRPRRILALVVLAVVLAAAIPAAALAFSDVSPGHPYGPAIAQLTDLGVVEGYPDGTFRPEREAWRQHFTKMLVISLGIVATEADTCFFVDVDVGGLDTLYPDNYIAVAASQGIVKGVGDGRFAPMAMVSRAQAVTMIVRALQALHPGLLVDPEASFQSTWGDFSVDHADNARLAEANGLLDGLGMDATHPGGNLGGLDPWSPMPRGELAQLLANMLDLMETETTPPPPVDVVALHDPDAALTADYGTCASGGCHQLNLVMQHVVDEGLGCETCHGAAVPAKVSGAIEAWRTTGEKQGCRVCHGSGVGDHRQLHELTDPNPTDCTSCHDRNLVDLHGSGGSAGACAKCHGPQATARVRQVVATFSDRSGNPRCADCHDQGTYHSGLNQAHTASKSGECGGCHLLVLPDEHNRSMGTSGSAGCATCHPLPGSFDWTGRCTDCHDQGTYHVGLNQTHTAGESGDCGGCHLLVLPDEHSRSTSSSRSTGCATCHPLPGSFDWSGLCADCHSSGGVAPARHLAEATAHQSNTSNCLGSGCHQSDVRVVHQSTALGCSTCHSTSAVPVTTDCVTCHGAGAHEVRAPFKDTCANCHSIGRPGQSLHDRHAVRENVPCATCHGASAPGCVAAACHEHSLQEIHAKDDHRPCTACHLDGPPPGGVGPGPGG